MNAIAAVPIPVWALIDAQYWNGTVPALVLALFSALMGRWRWFNPSKARTINIGSKNNNQKALEWRRSFGIGRWQWHGGAAAEEGGAVRTRQFVGMATSRKMVPDQPQRG